jgi:hypothetical protein
MKPIILVLAATLSALIATPALAADDCKVGSTGPGGEPIIADIALDLASGARLDPAVLPERASGVMCRRASLVPRPEDVRVLIEWRVAFAIHDWGTRALWIMVRAGTLDVTVTNGKLNAREKAAVKEWREAAQLRYVLAVAATRAAQ